MFCLRKKHRYVWFVLVAITFMAILAVSPTAYAGDEPSAAIQKEFIRALGRGDHDKVRALIGKGVDVNAEVGGLLPIMMAKDAEMVELLVGAGADVNATGSLLPGQTALMQAAMSGNVEVIRALAKAGADINHVNSASGATALELAIDRGDRKAVEALLKAGADVNAGRLLGWPPIHFAIVKGKEDIVRLLLDAGADLGLRDSYGLTPLMRATDMRRKQLVELLLKAGAEAASAKKDASGKKETAMDIAIAGGDPDIIEMLKKAGAKGSEHPPEPDVEQPNLPGRYTLECGIHDPPPVDLRHVPCSEEGQVVDSGLETAVLSKAFYEDGHPVPRENGCEVNLGSPGKYTLRTYRYKAKWRVICKYRLRGPHMESWLVSVKSDEPTMSETSHVITVAASPSRKPKKDKEPPSIRIVRPGKGKQFAFDGGNPGVVEIDAEAVVKGDCDEEPVWKVDGIDGSKKTLEPATPSSTVTIRFEGLPPRNDAFGKKRITASACGKSDSVAVEVFFPPKANNHPGEGSGETPNWFYYWGQTRAAGGVRRFLKYQKTIPAKNNPNDLVIGRFTPADEKVHLSDLVMTSKTCTQRMRWGAAHPDLARAKGVVLKPARGIDCFAELIMHEWQHRKEYFMWKGMEDLDMDGVPHAVEEVTVGCIDDDLSTLDLIRKTSAVRKSWYSCAQRPFANVTDREIYAYYVGWKWPIGKADKEDWSKCGKQWKNKDVCR